MVLASGATAAAPRYILVSGPGLEAPVLLPDWGENLRLFVSLIDAPPVSASTARLTSRRRLRLGLFWGWPERPLPTDPLDANQTGWFYPATDSQPAVIDIRVDGIRVPRVAPTTVLRILARHHVPTRSTGRPPDHDPRGCRPGEVRTLVRGFVAAFNQGDSAALDEVFAEASRFRWHSTTSPGARLRAAAANRNSLVPYLSGRHAAGERFRLRSFRLNGNGNDGVRVYGNFVYTLTRTTPERGSARFGGKGAALCYEDQPDVLIVWSMASRR